MLLIHLPLPSTAKPGLAVTEHRIKVRGRLLLQVLKRHPQSNYTRATITARITKATRTILPKRMSIYLTNSSCYALVNLPVRNFSSMSGSM